MADGLKHELPSARQTRSEERPQQIALRSGKSTSVRPTVESADNSVSPSTYMGLRNDGLIAVPTTEKLLEGVALELEVAPAAVGEADVDRQARGASGSPRTGCRKCPCGLSALADARGALWPSLGRVDSLWTHPTYSWW